nr:ABC transporter substrate-binding protein [Paraburkholderia strydomiana]
MAYVPAVHAQSTIKLGVVLPTSGAGAATGLPILDGVKVAVEEINAAGGVMGKKLEILSRDTQMKPATASSVAKELLTKEGVQIFIGPATSAESLAVSEFAKTEKVIDIIPSAKTEALTGTNLHDYIFQLPPTTDVQGKRMAELLKKEIGAKSVCFTGYDYPYTQDLFRNIRANLGDIKDAGSFLMPLGTTDYNTVITQLLGANCDTIMGTTWGPGFVAFVKQATPFGLFKGRKLLWGSSVGGDGSTTALGKAFPEGLWASADDLWYADATPAHVKYQRSLAKLEGRQDTNMWAITGYNSVYLVKAGIEKAKSTEPAALSTAMAGITFASPLGDLTVDPKNHRANSPEFYGQIVSVPGSDIKRMATPRLMH